MAKTKHSPEDRINISEGEIDKELMDTFPASDSPSWTLGLNPDKGLMKVIRVHAYGGPEQLRYEDIPIPKIGRGQVMVAVQAASVNPIDYKLASGMRRPVMDNKPVALPWIPGGDFSGIVNETGEGVVGIKRGDSVYGNCPAGGAYAQFAIVEANAVALKPRTISHVEAASVPLAAQTAWQALFKHGHLHAGQTVLIHGGSGGVGSFAIQLARWKKANVLATGSTNHLEYLHQLGADQTIDYHAAPFDSVAKDVDLVIDLIGGETQEHSFKVIRPGGVLVSTVSPPSEEEASRHKIHAVMMSMKPSVEQLEKLTELINSDMIKIHVAKVYSLSQAKEAWEDILSHHTAGKIVLEVS